MSVGHRRMAPVVFHMLLDIFALSHEAGLGDLDRGAGGGSSGAAKWRIAGRRAG